MGDGISVSCYEIVLCLQHEDSSACDHMIWTSRTQCSKRRACCFPIHKLPFHDMLNFEERYGWHMIGDMVSSSLNACQSKLILAVTNLGVLHSNCDLFIEASEKRSSTCSMPTMSLIPKGRTWCRLVMALCVESPSIMTELTMPTAPAAGSAWPRRDLVALKCKASVLPVIPMRIHALVPLLNIHASDTSSHGQCPCVSAHCETCN